MWQIRAVIRHTHPPQGLGLLYSAGFVRLFSRTLADADANNWPVYLQTFLSTCIHQQNYMSGFHLAWVQGNNRAAATTWLIIMSARCLTSKSGRCNHLPTDPMMLIYCPLSCPFSVILKGSLSAPSAPTYLWDAWVGHCTGAKSGGLVSYCILGDVGNQTTPVTKLGNVA